MLFEGVAAGPGQLDGLADGDATILAGELDDGVVGSGSEIAQREGLQHSTVNELLRLTLLEPVIIQTILDGQQPRCMSLLWFQRNPLPTNWVGQREVLAPDRVTSPRSPVPRHRGIRRTCPPAASRRP